MRYGLHILWNANIIRGQLKFKYKDLIINMIINSFNTSDDKEFKDCDYYKNCGRMCFENEKWFED